MPSFAKVAAQIGFLIVLVSVAAYLWEGFGEGKWWSLQYVLTFLIPIAVVPGVIWYMFVPRLLEYSDTEIRISTYQYGDATYQWEELECYGKGSGVFMVKFSGDDRPYQIYSGAYAEEDWARWTNVMKDRFPGREMAYCIGTRMVRKGRES